MDVEFAVKSIYTRTSGNSRSSVRFGVTSKGQYPCALEWQGDKLFLLMSQGIRKRMESKSKVPGYEGKQRCTRAELCTPRRKKW